MKKIFTPLLKLALVLLVLSGISSCSTTSDSADLGTSAQFTQNGGALKAHTANEQKDKKLMIKNKSKHDLSFDITFDDGDAGAYSAGTLVTNTYSTYGNVSAVSLFGIPITQGTTTTITLADGTQVAVTWTDNVIVVVDTLEMN